MRHAWPLWRRVELVAATMVALIVAMSAQAQEPLKIRIGWAQMPGHMIPVLYSKPEILKHYGKSYTVEPAISSA